MRGMLRGKCRSNRPVRSGAVTMPCSYRLLDCRCPLSGLFLIGGSLAPVVGTVSLGRRDSHADQGAVATQFSNSTGTGTSPETVRDSIPKVHTDRVAKEV